MHLVNIEGQRSSKVNAVGWFFTCFMETHETPSGDPYAFIHHGRANPSLAQQCLYFLILRFSKRLGVSLALDLEYFGKREKREVAWLVMMGLHKRLWGVS